MKRGLQQTQYFLLNRKGMSCSVDKTQDSRLDINDNFKGGGELYYDNTLLHDIFFGGDYRSSFTHKMIYKELLCPESGVNLR